MTVIQLAFPIDCGDGKEISKLELKRPKTRTIKKLVALLGPDVVKALIDGTGKQTPGTAGNVSTNKDLLAEAIGSLATMEKLDEINGILADVLVIDPSMIDGLDPADYPAIYEGLAGFFPGLFSNGDVSPLT
ncbi:MAG: hypothetical protein H2045_10635 [Rhizobiales bacterium]|nr:hypothetical protein [Hyphomicrobiales bacterium]